MAGKHILQKSARSDADRKKLKFAQALGLQTAMQFNVLKTVSSDSSSSDWSMQPVRWEYKDFENISKAFNREPECFCSKCSKYFEFSEFFDHMKESHEKYICLHCFYMGDFQDSHVKHLKLGKKICSTKKKLIQITCPAFLLFCVSCDIVFTEKDKFEKHKCLPKTHVNKDEFVKTKIDQNLQLMPSTSAQESAFLVPQGSSVSDTIVTKSGTFNSAIKSQDVEKNINNTVTNPDMHQTEQRTSDQVLYCYCRLPDDGCSGMIACDNVKCKIEWFHFKCVGIVVPPDGKWFCPNCRKASG